MKALTTYLLKVVLVSLAVIFIILQINRFKGSDTPVTENGHQDVKHPLRTPLDPIEIIRNDCGELCDPAVKGSPGPYFDQIRVPINCQALFRNDFIDRSHGLQTAPKVIPRSLYKEYTMNGRVPITSLYFNEGSIGTGGSAKIWTKEQIESDRDKARKGTLEGTYSVSEVKALIDGLNHAPSLKNGRVLVIGSQNPWVEACVLEAGAREVVTLEYGLIISKHPQIKTLLPIQFRKNFLDGTLGAFDAVVTFSSVEHSGLGRFGDALNPWGDIIAIARSWCVTKEGGSLTIGVMYDQGKDAVVFNAHRVYGNIRYPFLTANWKQYYRGIGIQRVHVFTKQQL